MNREEFFKEVQNKVERRLGADFETRLQNVRKNNNVRLRGLMIREKGKNISPTVYLDSYYTAYEDGMSMREIADQILRIIREESLRTDLDLNFLSDYEAVKDRICYRLINEEKNRDILPDMPHIPFLDLAICFFYPFEHHKIGNGSILIRNEIAQRWKVSVQEMWRAANQNTPRHFRPECSSMEMLLTGEEGEALREELLGAKEDFRMYVLSNRQRIFGAAVLLYEGWPEKIARRFGGNYYILPSSVHEVILLPEKGDERPEDLRNLIREVNAEEVESEEVLSDNLYYYDREKKNIRIIEN